MWTYVEVYARGEGLHRPSVYNDLIVNITALSRYKQRKIVIFSVLITEVILDTSRNLCNGTVNCSHSTGIYNYVFNCLKGMRTMCIMPDFGDIVCWRVA